MPDTLRARLARSPALDVRSTRSCRRLPARQVDRLGDPMFGYRRLNALTGAGRPHPRGGATARPM
jgi:hypothetical protein